MLVANGHHWDPRWPEPAFPGSEEFEGEQMHVHDYREPDVLEGKRVLVLGIGNSATDIAVESSRIAEKTFLAMRRGAYVVPKYLFGKPTDECGVDAGSPDASGGAAASSSCAMLRHDGRRYDAPTACRSPTTSCSRRIRRSPPSCSPASATATSR